MDSIRTPVPARPNARSIFLATLAAMFGANKRGPLRVPQARRNWKRNTRTLRSSHAKNCCGPQRAARKRMQRESRRRNRV